MPTQGQRRSMNVKKTQQRPKPAARQRAVQPAEGLKRKRPGTTGEGHYYHIEIRRKREFVDFRTQDVGRKGHVQRVAGQRPNGSWDTVKWLIGKEDANIQNGKLVPITKAAQKVIAELGSKPVRVKGDIFEARPPRDIPEREKPTAAQQRAQRENIKKAQSARRGK
jgi:hypothetical protein